MVPAKQRVIASVARYWLHGYTMTSVVSRTAVMNARMRFILAKAAALEIAREGKSKPGLILKARRML